MSFFNGIVKKVEPQFNLKFSLLIVISFLFSLFESFSIAMVFPLVQGMLGGGESANQPEKLKVLFEFIKGIGGEKNQVEYIFIVFFILNVCRVLLKFIKDGYRVQFNSGILVKSQKALFKKYINAPMESFNEVKKGELIFYVTVLCTEVGGAFTVLTALFADIINVVLICLVIAFVSEPKVLFAVFVLGLIAGVLYKSVSGLLVKLGGQQVKAHSEYINQINEMIEGHSEIYVFDRISNWIKTFHDKSKLYLSAKVKGVLVKNIPGSIVEILFLLGICVLGIIFVRKGQVGVLLPFLATYAAAFLKVSPSIVRIVQHVGDLKNKKEIMNKFEKSLDLFKERNMSSQGHEKLSAIKSIVLDKVSYKVSDRQILNSITMQFERGKIYNIKAESGKGKSTLLRMMAKETLPTEGIINFNEVDYKQYENRSFFSRVSYLSQKPYIFNTSVEENITMGSSDYNENDIKEVLDAAELLDYIQNLEGGMSCNIGASKHNLSGGQMQRIAIARALIKKPDLLILDESTSAMDEGLEEKIFKNIKSLLKNTIVIIVSHNHAAANKISDKVYEL